MRKKRRKRGRRKKRKRKKRGWVDEPLLTSDFGFATGCTCTHWGWGSPSTPSTLRTGGSLDRLAAAPTKWWIDNPQFQPPRRGGIGSQTIARTMFALDACEHNYYLYAYHTWLKINL
jgi:hypothetical protein